MEKPPADLVSAPMWIQVVALTVFVASVVVNAYFGIWGPHSTAQVADTFNLFVMPPRWTFAGIWGAIYVLFALTLLYVTLKDKWPSKAYWATVLASILNATWLGVFSIGTKVSNIAAFFIVLALFVTVYALWKFIYAANDTDWKYFAVRNVVSLYFGWVLVATILSFGVLLIYYAGVSHKAFVITFWVLTPLLFIGITAWTFINEKAHGVKSLVGFWIAGLWAFAGALISTLANKQFL